MKAQTTARYWLVLAACCGLAASAIGVFTNSLGVFYTPIAGELGVGRGAIALHATLSALTSGLLSPFFARAMKKAPLPLFIGIGALLASGCTALMSVSGSVWLFNLLGILRGVGLVTFSLMPVTTVINNWFHARHGVAVGVALSFSGLSGAVFNPLFSALIASVGWRTAYLYMALFGFLLALPGVFTLRLTPAEVGLTAYGEGATGSTANLKAPGGETKIYLPAMLLLVLMTFLHTSVTGIAQHFPGYAESIGMTAQIGATMVSAGMVGNIVSKLLIGVLSDRVGSFRAALTMICVNAAALLGLLIVPVGLPAAALGAAFLYGTVYSVGAVGIPLLTRSLFGAKNYASVYSVITLFTSLGSSLSLTIIGLVYDFTGGYRTALVGGIAIDCVNACILIALLGMSRRRHQ